MSTAMLAGANPIRKVVNLLQNMEQKVIAEGEKQDALFEKFECYCKTSGGNLGKGVAEANERIPELESAIEETKGKLAQMKSDIKSHKADREAAETNVAESTEIRNKDNSAYNTQRSEDTADLEAAKKAVKAISKGLGSSFLQSEDAPKLRTLVFNNEKMLSADRDGLLAFLSTSAEDREEAPGTSEILGILKQMVDEMTANIADADAQEEKAVKDHSELVAAKKKEIDTLSHMIEVKLQRVGELALSLAELEDDLQDTQDALSQDTKFLMDLEKRCKNSKAEREAMVKTRRDELLALADTIKILNDDDALELFKKTLPGAASFLQLQTHATVSSKVRRAAALAAIAQIPRMESRPGLDLVELSLKGQKVGFEKVIAMIDVLMGELKEEQSDDDEKVEYCAEEFDTADDKKKATEREISDTEKAIAKAKEDIGSLLEDMDALEDGIKKLDKDVTEATANRKEEHEDYKELMASDSTAIQVLEFAKNRLNKFYNPKLYKAPPKRELSEEDRITVNMGGTLAPTAAPGGIAGTGIGLLQGAPPPPPEAGAAYAKKSEESNGVIAMMDLLIADLKKEMTQAETEEKDAQADYEKFLEESAAKRAKDSKSYEEKEGARAEAQGALEDHKTGLASSQKNLEATLEYIRSLHADCDFIMRYHSLRKELRSQELDGLSNAKAALHGASLLDASSRPTRFLGQL